MGFKLVYFINQLLHKLSLVEGDEELGQVLLDLLHVVQQRQDHLLDVI